MTHEIKHRSVILLLNAQPATDNKFIKRWFKKSRFVTFECADIFDAFEKISDFTVKQRPDVILLEVESMPDGFQTAKKMTEVFTEADDLPIFAFSDGGANLGDCECFKGSLVELESRLNSLIPLYTEVRRTIAA